MATFINTVEANLGHGDLIRFSVAAVNAIGVSNFSAYNTAGA